MRKDRLVDYLLVLGSAEDRPLTPLRRYSRSNSLAISPIMYLSIVAAKDKEAPRGFEKVTDPNGVPANLNSGFAGRLRVPVYLCECRSPIMPSPAPHSNISLSSASHSARSSMVMPLPITDLEVLSVEKKEIPSPGFTKLEGNLSPSSLGKHTVLAIKRDNSQDPIIDIKIITKGEECPHGFTLINKSINGQDTFVCYKRAALQRRGKVGLQPYLLDRFPMQDYSDYPLDALGVSMLCFPRGMILKQQHEVDLPTFLTFVLTDANGGEVYGASLLFYEPLRKGRVVPGGGGGGGEDRRSSMTKNNSNNNSGRNSKSGPASGEGSPSSPPPNNSNNNNSNDNNVLTALREPEPQLFCPKACVLLSHWPFYEGFKMFLNQLYRITVSPSCELPIERHIGNFLRDVPVPQPCVWSARIEFASAHPPPRVKGNKAKNKGAEEGGEPGMGLGGNLSTMINTDGVPANYVPPPSRLPDGSPLPAMFRAVKYTLGHATITIARPLPIFLPLMDSSLVPLLQCLSIDNIIRLFDHCLSEGKTLLFSNSYSALNPVAEAIRSLLFPFKWQCVFIPILPSNLSYTLRAPVPFLVGMHRTFLDEIRVSDDVLQVDLDRNVIIPPKFVEANERPLVQFPPDLKAELQQTLSEFAHVYEVVDTSQDDQSLYKVSEPKHDVDEKKLRIGFFRHMVRLLAGYRSFILPAKAEEENLDAAEVLDVELHFDVTSFVNSHPPHQREWYTQLSQTQMLSEFIMQRVSFSDRNHQLLFFDWCCGACEELNPNGELAESEAIITRVAQHIEHLAPYTEFTAPAPNDLNLPPGPWKYSHFPKLTRELFGPLYDPSSAHSSSLSGSGATKSDDPVLVSQHQSNLNLKLGLNLGLNLGSGLPTSSSSSSSALSLAFGARAPERLKTSLRDLLETILGAINHLVQIPARLTEAEVLGNTQVTAIYEVWFTLFAQSRLEVYANANGNTYSGNSQPSAGTGGTANVNVTGAAPANTQPGGGQAGGDTENRNAIGARPSEAEAVHDLLCMTIQLHSMLTQARVLPTVKIVEEICLFCARTGLIRYFQTMYRILSTAVRRPLIGLLPVYARLLFAGQLGVPTPHQQPAEQENSKNNNSAASIITSAQSLTPPTSIETSAICACKYELSGEDIMAGWLIGRVLCPSCSKKLTPYLIVHTTRDEPPLRVPMVAPTYLCGLLRAHRAGKQESKRKPRAGREKGDKGSSNNPTALAAGIGAAAHPAPTAGERRESVKDRAAERSQTQSTRFREPSFSERGLGPPEFLRLPSVPSQKWSIGEDGEDDDSGTRVGKNSAGGGGNDDEESSNVINPGKTNPSNNNSSVDEQLPFLSLTALTLFRSREVLLWNTFWYFVSRRIATLPPELNTQAWLDEEMPWGFLFPTQADSGVVSSSSASSPPFSSTSLRPFSYVVQCFEYKPWRVVRQDHKSQGVEVDKSVAVAVRTMTQPIIQHLNPGGGGGGSSGGGSGVIIMDALSKAITEFLLARHKVREYLLEKRPEWMVYDEAGTKARGGSGTGTPTMASSAASQESFLGPAMFFTASMYKQLALQREHYPNDVNSHRDFALAYSVVLLALLNRKIDDEPRDDDGMGWEDQPDVDEVSNSGQGHNSSAYNARLSGEFHPPPESPSSRSMKKMAPSPDFNARKEPSFTTTSPLSNTRELTALGSPLSAGGPGAPLGSGGAGGLGSNAGPRLSVKPKFGEMASKIKSSSKKLLNFINTEAEHGRNALKSKLPTGATSPGGPSPVPSASSPLSPRVGATLAGPGVGPSPPPPSSRQDPISPDRPEVSTLPPYLRTEVSSLDGPLWVGSGYLDRVCLALRLFASETRSALAPMGPSPGSIDGVVDCYLSLLGHPALGSASAKGTPATTVPPSPASSLASPSAVSSSSSSSSAAYQEASLSLDDVLNEAQEDLRFAFEVYCRNTQDPTMKGAVVILELFLSLRDWTLRFGSDPASEEAQEQALALCHQFLFDVPLKTPSSSIDRWWVPLVVKNEQILAPLKVATQQNLRFGVGWADEVTKLCHQWLSVVVLPPFLASRQSSHF